MLKLLYFVSKTLIDLLNDTALSLNNHGFLLASRQLTLQRVVLLGQMQTLSFKPFGLAQQFIHFLLSPALEFLILQLSLVLVQFFLYVEHVALITSKKVHLMFGHHILHHGPHPIDALIQVLIQLIYCLGCLLLFRHEWLMVVMVVTTPTTAKREFILTYGV